jgi:hypothetical protein
MQQPCDGQQDDLSGGGSNKCPHKGEHEWGWVSASVPAIGGPRGRHAVPPRGTLNSEDFLPYRIPTPHELENKQRYDLLASRICNYGTELYSTIG